jgi:hypothetical protein
MAEGGSMCPRVTVRPGTPGYKGRARRPAALRHADGPVPPCELWLAHSLEGGSNVPQSLTACRRVS